MAAGGTSLMLVLVLPITNARRAVQFALGR